MLRTRSYAAVGRAFTLVEVLIVVVILGILAAVVVPSFANATEPSRQAAFITSMKSFGDAVQLYQARNGDYPPDGVSGTIPAGLENYISPDDWDDITPIGGSWDTEDTPAGYGVGVHFDGQGQTRDDQYMLEIDETFDDGNLATGSFQTTGSGRYYLIVSAN
ncbi:MAG TPA: prepilin-type N-terminal cleavage/methylation domain-containing protein [Phycisphaerales bacterium]|nr:prepilin-type N-terminal cleavage/methylation domain-containing protein [Phycisphaerales bacterium]